MSNLERYEQVLERKRKRKCNCYGNVNTFNTDNNALRLEKVVLDFRLL